MQRLARRTLASMSTANIIDDKSPLVIPFLLDRLHKHRQSSTEPFFVGLNGVQGAGKTTLVESLTTALSKPPYSLPTLVFSIDDLYLPHHTLVNLAWDNPNNPLLQQRGQPGTHDVALGTSVFQALRERQQNIAIPSYDKSLHHGQGDRASIESWQTVNKPGEPAVDVVLFEGWCVGFRPLETPQLEELWQAAKVEIEQTSGADDVKDNGRLGRQALDHLQVVNDALKYYDALTDQLNAFVHIDAEDNQYVYEWRQQQEAALRVAKGTGMTDEQVVRFVNGYYPAYELFLHRLRSGIFPGHPGNQLRMVIDRSRRVKTHQVI